MEYDFAITQNELLTHNMNEFQKYVKSSQNTKEYNSTTMKFRNWQN